MGQLGVARYLDNGEYVYLDEEAIDIQRISIAETEEMGKAIIGLANVSDGARS